MAHLPTELVARLLADASFQPGGRPSHFRAVVPGSLADAALQPPPSTIEHPGPADGWIFKETAAERQKRRHPAADRWRNCGGVAGARDLPAARPVLRRRYGKLTPAVTNAPLLGWCAQPCAPGEKRTAAHRTTRPTTKEGFAYHEYTLLDRARTRGDGAFEDNVSAYLFHVVPVKDAAAEAPRLGLPESVELGAEEARSLSAILRVEGFAVLPGLDSASGPQPPGAGGAAAAAAAGGAAAAAASEGEILPTEEVIRRICDTSYEPGQRPGLLKPAQHGWLFKEPGRPARLRRGQHEDRWKHSGGTKGAKDLYLQPTAGALGLDATAQAMCSRPVVRRRNGVIQPPGKQGFTWRYHQYTLLTRKTGENGEEEWEEDVASPILFHVQPADSKTAPKPRGGRRASAAAANPVYQARAPVGLPAPLSSYAGLLAGPQSEIPTFSSYSLGSSDMNGLPSLRSNASSRKRPATAAPVVASGVKRSAASSASGTPRVVPIVKTVVVPTVSAVPAATAAAPASAATSLQDAIKFMEWWQGGESAMGSVDIASESLRRTRSSFAALSSTTSNELSALPSLGWLGPTESAGLFDLETSQLAQLPP